MATRWTSKHTGQKIDDTIDGVCNPNLLDNGYFANPVNQRGGYVVPPGVPSYRDSTLTKSAGDTTGYRTVVETTSTYIAYIGSDGHIYYCAPGNAVRGYTGAGYGIDRWKSGNSNLTVNLTGDGIVLSSGSAAGYLSQYFDGGITIEDSYTIAALVEAITGTAYFQAIYADGTYSKAMKLTTGLNAIAVKATKTISRVLLQINAGASVTVKAAKLELGSQQTLAHQDSTGNWVLNEIPDYGEQLARCQRYAIGLNPNRQNVPIIGTVKTDGTTMWLSMPIPTSLRTTPVITNSRGTVIVSNDSGSSEIAFGNDVRVSSGMITVAMTGSTKRDGFAYMLDSGGVGIPTALLSADL